VGIGDKQATKLRELAQQHVEEPVVSAAIFLRKGETASRTIGAFARGASLHKWAESMERAPDFPAQTLVALTDDKMCLFEAKGGFSWKVKKPLGKYAYGSFQATDAGSGALTRFLTLTFLDGHVAELETQVSGAQKWQGEVLDELVARSGSPLSEEAT
jgi:hypothetical protein